MSSSNSEPTIRPTGSPSTVLYRRPSRETAITAGIAVLGLIVVEFLVGFVSLIGNAIGYDPSLYTGSFLSSPIGIFLGGLVLYPFFYYVAAFAALTFLFPVVRESPLQTILARAVAAGASGVVVLAVVGIVTGIVVSAGSGDWINLLLYVVFIPLGNGILYTAVLAGGATLAWLWLGRQHVTTQRTSPAEQASAVEPVQSANQDAPAASPESVPAPQTPAFAAPTTHPAPGERPRPPVPPTPAMPPGPPTHPAPTEPPTRFGPPPAPPETPPVSDNPFAPPPGYNAQR